MKKVGGILLMVALLLAACGDGEGGDSPAMEEPAGDASPAASVEFTSPEEGATVSNPVKLQMRAEGVTIEPASSGVRENAGHLHVMVDTPCLPEGEVIPNDDTHRHFGMAQTEAELTLEPGEHELCLQLGDGAHVAKPITSQIQITVE